MPKLVAKAYKSNKMQYSPTKLWYFVRVIVIITVALFVISRFINAASFFSISNYFYGFSQISDGSHIKSVTWNMAAINNNPFEYWITTDIQSYNNMMKNMSNVIESPSESVDVAISSIFTDVMFDDLINQIQQNTKWRNTAKKAMDNIDIVKKIWHDDYKKRKAISQFIKDPLIGKKRLASMPDRLTNTISSKSNSNNDNTNKDIDVPPLTRPTVINCYDGDLSSVPLWWKQWKQFMFATKIDANTDKVVADSLLPIKRSKYPAVTEDEELVSLPLQLLCLALFDSILVHTLNIIASPETGPHHDNNKDSQGGNGWQPLRNLLCNRLNRKKSQRSVEILQHQYTDSDIMFLQEVGSGFINTFYHTKPSSSTTTTSTDVNSKILIDASATGTQSLHELYDMYMPEDRDGGRDQNSVILLRKEYFAASQVKEVTADILTAMKQTAAAKGEKIPISKGDLFAMTAVHKTSKEKYFLCSFHGDTNGLATIPVVASVRKYAVSMLADSILLFGMDANAYKEPEPDQLGVDQLAAFYRNVNLNSCYGQYPDKYKNVTTCHARTHLQPQLNKAVGLEDKERLGDRNPKDFIVFFDTDFLVQHTAKDNTGQRGVYIDGQVFPTLAFPSDHAITSTHLIRKTHSLTSTHTSSHSDSSDNKSLRGQPSSG